VEGVCPQEALVHGDEYGGSLLSLPLISGTTAITLTRDGRLFTLPEGEDDFETVTNMWEPLFRYIEQKARELSAEENIPFERAVDRVLYRLGFNARAPDPEDPQIKRAELAIYDSEYAGPEDKRRVLRTLKRIYMDELGLDWMPLPLAHSDYYMTKGESSLKKSTEWYIQHLPSLLRELGLDPEDPTLKLRLQALRKLLYETHWPAYWDVRQALALVEALHKEGRITDEQYKAYLQTFIEDQKKFLREAEGLAEEIGGEDGFVVEGVDAGLGVVLERLGELDRKFGLLLDRLERLEVLLREVLEGRRG